MLGKRGVTSIICFIVLCVSSACCFISCLNASLLLSKFSSLILASFNFASVEDLYSSSSSFYSRTSFLICLFSFSNSAFFCSKASSVDTGLTFIFDNKLKFGSLGCTPVGMKSVALLSIKHKSVCTQVHRTFTSFKLL